MVTNSQPIPMPKIAFTTNWTDERCRIRTTSNSTATATLTSSAVRSSRVVSQVTVNSTVGTAASTMPRRPPSAFDSWVPDHRLHRVDGGLACGVAHGVSHRFAHGMSS